MEGGQGGGEGEKGESRWPQFPVVGGRRRRKCRALLLLLPATPENVIRNKLSLCTCREPDLSPPPCQIRWEGGQSDDSGSNKIPRLRNPAHNWFYVQEFISWMEVDDIMSSIKIFACAWLVACIYCIFDADHLYMGPMLLKIMKLIYITSFL